MLTEALAYAANGWRVFPCTPRGKTPLAGVRWKSAATTNPEQIRQWWEQNPKANIGAVTGGDLGVVLDLDRAEALAELPAEPTTGRVALTGGGGQHRFFRTVTGLGNHTGQLPSGIDIRGDGTGYVILPPSVHASGRRYTWEGGRAGPADELPGGILKLITTPKRQPNTANAKRARAWLLARPGSVHGWQGIEGRTGDCYLFETAQCVLRGFDLAPAQALDLLTEWNGTCDPPWPAERLRYKIQQAAQHGRMTIGEKLGPTPATPPTRTTPATPAATPARRPFAPFVPLFTPGDLAPFPLDAVPEWSADFIAALAESTQTPPELAGLLTLTSCSAALQRKIVVMLKPGWLEPVNLWTVIAMAPSSRKSPVYSRIVEPIEQWEKLRSAATNADKARYAAEREIEERRLATLQAAAAKAKHDDRDALRYELTDLAERLAGMKPPPSERLLISDVTPETFVTFLAASNGTAALLSDEGGIFDNMAGRYARGRANADAFLKSYSGTAIRVDRRERTEHVTAPALAMGLTVQPCVLREIAANPALAGRGLLARPIFAVPPSNIGTRQSAIGTAPVPAALGQAYHEHLTSLLDEPLPATPRVLTLAPAARDALMTFDQWLEQQIAPDGELSHLAEWCGKLPGTAARIAGVLHAAETGGDEISGRTIHRAIALAHWAIPHADAAIGVMGATDETRAAERVWRAIQRAARRTQEATTTHRAIAQALKRTLRSDIVYGALAALADNGYLRTDDCKAYEIRPELMAALTATENI